MHRSGFVAAGRPLTRALTKGGLTNRTYSTYYPKGPPPASRPLHTTKALNSSRDNSTIDFAYMPEQEFTTPALAEVTRIPLLPDNYNPIQNYSEHEEVIEPVSRPQISTVSANGTHIDNPSAMSDVTDNHALEIDPFDLPNTVTNAANKITNAASGGLKEGSQIRELWSGLLDDFLGERKVSHA